MPHESDYEAQANKRLPKKVLVALPSGLLEQIDMVAEVEHRTRSELIREALRRYLETFRRAQGALAPLGKSAAPVPTISIIEEAPVAAAVLAAINTYDPALSAALHE